MVLRKNASGHRVPETQTHKPIQMDVWKETVQRLPVTGTVQLEQSAILAEIQEKTGRVSYDK